MIFNFPVFVPKKAPKYFMPHFPLHTGNIKIYNSFKVKHILSKFNSPELKLQNIIHIVGTNGKGSTCAYLNSILLEAGFNVNVFTSPHLHCANERIKFNNAEIKDEELYKLTEKVRFICEEEKIELTLFESLTIIGMIYFASKNADFTIIEAGMGGALDVTNIFNENQISSVILTSISKDHTRYLGENLYDITKHKLGIAKPFKPIIFAPLTKESLQAVLEEILITPFIPFFYGRDYNVSLIEFEDGIKGFEFVFQNNEPLVLPLPPLLGNHQVFNLCGVLTAIKAMNIEITEEKLINGILNTKWEGRLEKVILPNNNFEIWFDGAHNEGGAIALCNWLKEQKIKKTVLIVSKTRGSEVVNFAKPFKNLIEFVICIEGEGEALPEFKEVLKKGFEINEIKALCRQNLKEAVEFIFTQSEIERIIIAGSLYLAREISKFYF